MQLAQAAPNRCPGVPRLTLQVSSGRWPRRLVSPGPPLVICENPSGGRALNGIGASRPAGRIGGPTYFQRAFAALLAISLRRLADMPSARPTSRLHRAMPSDKRREPAPASGSTSTSTRPRPTVFAHACKTWHSIRRTLSLPIRPPKMIAPSRSGWPRLPDRGGQSRPRFP